MPGHASPGGSPTPTNSADHSPSAKNPLRKHSGLLHSVVTPSAPVTHTSRLCRSCGPSGENGQETKTDSPLSKVTVSVPSKRIEALTWRQSISSVSTFQLRRGVVESTTAPSLHRSTQTLLIWVHTC